MQRKRGILKNRVFRVGIGVIGTILIILFVAALSWIVTCGIIKLITYLIGIKFSWKIATAIWLAMFLLHSVFKSNTSGKE